MGGCSFQGQALLLSSKAGLVSLHSLKYPCVLKLYIWGQKALCSGVRGSGQEEVQTVLTRREPTRSSAYLAALLRKWCVFERVFESLIADLIAFHSAIYLLPQSEIHPPLAKISPEVFIRVLCLYFHASSFTFLRWARTLLPILLATP